ncbi:MAG: tetratricopeptide repeat protein [Fibrobacteria bacterium]|nr:tetratricopeptide repeat protein [Fibrobacteria bacterium]
MSSHMDRASLLISQGRYRDAMQYIEKLIAENPDESSSYNLLALAQNNQGMHKEALETANTAIGMDPEVPMYHYIKGLAQYNLNQTKNAEASAREALRLDSEEPEIYELLSSITFRKKKWQETLDLAEEGLKYQSEHSGLVAIRSQALMKLNRKDEAGASIEAILQKDPENPVLHESLGMSLLEKGDAKRALIHFKEAIRLNPESENARLGIIESIKARNIIYAGLLKFLFFMSRLDTRVQYMIFFGGWFLQKTARKTFVEMGYPGFAYAIIIIWVGFILMTWTKDTLFNILLKLHPQGKHALTDEESKAAVQSALCLAVGLIVFGLSFLPGYRLLSSTAIGFLVMLIPISTIYSGLSYSSIQKTATWFTLVLLVFQTCALVAAVTGYQGITILLSTIVIGACALSSWIFAIWQQKYR